jgi:hypothetical protein
MYVCIMRQCFGVGTSYGSWLGLTIPAWGCNVTGVPVAEPSHHRQTKHMEIDIHFIRENVTLG